MNKFKILFISMLLMLPCVLMAQDIPTMYWVHEDRVKPAMMMEYEKLQKELVENCKKHNIDGLRWISTSTSDQRYLYVSPINSMSDINYDG